MGIVVYFLILGNAGIISSTVSDSSNHTPKSSQAGLHEASLIQWISYSCAASTDSLSMYLHEAVYCRGTSYGQVYALIHE